MPEPVGLPATADGAERAVSVLFRSFSRVEEFELEHARHEEGREHRVEFRLSFPNGPEPTDLPGRYQDVEFSFRWREVDEVPMAPGRRERAVLATTYRDGRRVVASAVHDEAYSPGVPVSPGVASSG